MKSIKFINIVIHSTQPALLKAAAAVSQLLSKKSTDHQIIAPTVKDTQLIDFDLPISNDLSNLQNGLILSIGGDGSLLSLIAPAIETSSPILGLNLGRLGFLTDVLPEDMNTLSKIIDGEFTQENRSLLSLEIPHTDNNLALNEILIAQKASCKTLDFVFSLNQSPVAHHRADGLMIATPTGSTAYNLSCGGPIITPLAPVLVVTPICTHKLSSRPLVISDDTWIDVHIDGSQSSLYLDGKPHPEQASHIRIRKAKQHLQLIHPTGYSFFENLKTKLYWET